MIITRSILLVSQDKRFVTHFKEIIRPYGFGVIHHNSFNSAIFSVQKKTPAGILTDKELKDCNGYYLCRKIREIYTGPLIFLSPDKEKLNDLELLAFETGVDDYLSKDTHSEILFARLKAVMRRSEIPRKPLKKKVSVDSLLLDPVRRDAMIDNHPMDLTSMQFDLLWYLALRRGEVITRDELYPVVLDKEYNGMDRSLDVMISRIRHKLKGNTNGQRYLKTVHGEGYCFTPH